MLARVNPWKGGQCNVREYEVTVVIHPQLNDEARNQLIEDISGRLTFGDDEASKPVINHWGRRQLAYPIRKNKEGYYVLYEAKLDPTQVRELERNFQYNEDILRYLVVRKDNV